jgi:hypothetical protein
MLAAISSALVFAVSTSSRTKETAIRLPTCDSGFPKILTKESYVNAEAGTSSFGLCLSFLALNAPQAPEP